MTLSEWGRSVGECLGLFLSAILPAVASAMPDGTEWEDPSRQSEGTLPPHAEFGSFPDAESAKLIRPEGSPWRISLDSESDWRFSWCRRPSERPRDFFRPSFDVSSWEVVKVPCSWQAMGIRASGERFEPPVYSDPKLAFAPDYPERRGPGPGKVIGHPVPDDWTFGPEDNPVGSYRRSFSVPPDWLRGDRIVLRLDGVESFHYAWVNGTYLGFSKSSRDAAEYDVTGLLHAGDNVLAIEVYRNSDGSWLESMDMWRLGGIFRSVSLQRTPSTCIRDVFLRTRPVREGAYDGDWAVDLDVDVLGGEPVTWDVRILDGERDVPHVRKGGALLVRSPRLWNAETPNLYTLVIELKAKDGRVTEAVPLQLGFREVKITGEGRDRVFRLNGRPVKLKGVNRHESDPLYGHFTPDAAIRRDLELLKRGNFNCIRTCHYPQSGYFYYLANKYGFYVMDEANLESHCTGFGKDSLSHDPAWRDAHLFRVRNLVERDKCQPCVVIWSLGNEAGPGENLKACREWVRARDASRPVQYEGENDHADMGSCMYPSVEKVREIAGGGADVRHKGRPVKYPFFLVEYAHNLVHGVGNLEDFQEAIESSDRILGGAVWDFADQGLFAVSNGVRYLATSGDFGERPVDSFDGANGYVLADRRPEPSFLAAAHAFRPFRTSLAKDGRSLRVENVCFFRDAAGFVCRMSVLSDGRSVGEPEELALDLQPRSTRTVPLPDRARELLAAGGSLVSVRVEFALREVDGLLPKGWVVARDQVDLGRRLKAAFVRTDPPSVRMTRERMVLESGGAAVSFDLRTGAIVSIVRGGRELLLSPVALDVFRAPTGGDTESRVSTWTENGLRRVLPELVSLSSPERADDVLSFRVRQRFRGVCRERLSGYNGVSTRIDRLGEIGETNACIEVDTRYSAFGGGRLRIASRFRQTGPGVELPRIGWRFVFDGGDEVVDWFGLGPGENYSDCKGGAVLGRWSLPVADFQFPYARNEDSGSRMETYEVALAKSGVAIEAPDAPFSFMASPYSPTELILQPHHEFLSPASKTEIGVYPKVRGLGLGNLGPEPFERDRIGAHECPEVVFDLVVSPAGRDYASDRTFVTRFRDFCGWGALAPVALPVDFGWLE